MFDVDVLLKTLIDSEIPDQISQKIDAAYETFDRPHITINCHRDFNEYIAAFVRHIYISCILLPKNLSKDAGFGEALGILETYYDNHGATGYDAAYLDAIGESGKGIKFVLREIAEIIKAKEFAQWLNSVFISTIDPLNKNHHLEIVRVLLEKYGTRFPENVIVGNPARFISLYRELIERIRSSEMQAKQIASLNKYFYNI
jgi:hypothetical protein